jgi:protoporphyrin/coproporphyrin ferrochelatase
MTGRTGVVLMAYGTPSGPDAVEAYYTDIRRGRPPTPDQLADLIRRYDAIGGVSPLAERTEAQRSRLQVELDARRPQHYDVVLGLKHADPSIEEGVTGLAARGVSDVIGVVLAPHWSALSVAQYLDRAGAAAGVAGLAFQGVESWHLEPAFLDFLAGAVRSELGRLPAGTTVVFSAHSLPERILTTGDPYPAQLAETADAVASRVGLERDKWRVAWQSAGRTPEPWLGPDILAVIDELAAAGRAGVLVCACGFVADHLEILYDLDIEARQRAEAAGLAFARTACVNDDPGVIGALADRVIALADSRGAAVTGG